MNIDSLLDAAGPGLRSIPVKRWWRGIPVVCALLVAGTIAPAGAADSEAVKTEKPSAWDAPEPWKTDRMYVQTSVATAHFNPSPDHVNTQYLLNFEWRFQDRPKYGQWVAGFAGFNNSFGQSSQYLYGGWLARPFDDLQPLYFKITAGVLHGYKGEYQNKIPFNSSGYAPAALPSIGYCINRFCSELIVFGTAGAMLTLGLTIP